MKKSTKTIKERYTPTIHGRASICTWDLHFYFLLPEQRNGFLKELLDDELAGQYHIELWEVAGDSVTHSQYHVKINEFSWANNLERVAKLLVKYDYDMGYDE